MSGAAASRPSRREKSRGTASLGRRSGAFPSSRTVSDRPAGVEVCPRLKGCSQAAAVGSAAAEGDLGPECTCGSSAGEGAQECALGALTFKERPEPAGEPRKERAMGPFHSSEESGRTSAGGTAVALVR